MPAVTLPVLFNTPQADEILSALKVFPPDNSFNQGIEHWPLHPNSQRIVASIGREKPLRYNTDMGFVLVPPDQPRVSVHIVEYPGESDRGPFPVPDDIPTAWLSVGQGELRDGRWIPGRRLNGDEASYRVNQSRSQTTDSDWEGLSISKPVIP